MKKTTKSSQRKKRIQIMLLLILLAFGGIFGRLVWIQLFKGPELSAMAYSNRFKNVEIEARRGNIFDAQGRPLAISISSDSFYANPPAVKRGNAQETAKILAEILGKEESAVYELITRDQQFVWIQRKVTKEQADAIKGQKLRGIASVEEPERIYPKESLLANVLGFVGLDNNGLSGLEAYYDSVLSGTPGTLLVEQDKRNLNIPDSAQKYVPPLDGVSLTLTIDETIQYIAERELKKMVDTHQPDQAGIIVMDPNTGAVLAMAEMPTFDPNRYNQYDPKTWRNFLISDIYEPGSTYKTIVLSGALEEGIASLEDPYYCGGAISVKGGTIRCWRTGRPHLHQSLLEGVQNSCNPVFVSLGLEMGKEIFYKYLNGFGFSQKTGIDLPGEGSSILVGQSRATELDLSTMSIGQANAVTPIQMVAAFSAVCNGGTLMQPYLVEKMTDAQGQIIKEQLPISVNQIISPETSQKVLRALETVVNQGTGKTAYVDGYRAGGKTGTAQKILPGGGYSSSEFIPSFMGVAPTNDPRIVVLVIADNPKGPHTGAVVCAPVFKAVVNDTLSYLQIPKQVSPDLFSSSTEALLLEDLTGRSLDEAKSTLINLKLVPEVIGEGNIVVGQLPLGGTTVYRGHSVVLYTKIPEVLLNEQFPMPELTGKSRSEVEALASDVNLEIEVQGDGIVVYQEPKPGTPITSKTNILVHLEIGQTDDQPVGP